MPFELEKMTEVRVLDVGTLASKDRKPDELPGAQLLLQATLPHGYLAMFDKTLPSWLYETSTGAHANLEGIESADLTSVGEHLKRLSWAYQQTGNEVVIDHGIGGKSNIPLADAKAYRLSFQPLKGGSVRVQWTLDIPSLTDATRGKLSGLKATNIKMTMRAPTPEEDAQGRLDGDDDDDAAPTPAAPRKPAAAERAAVAKVKGGKAPPASPIKYRDAATGSTWSGRGLMPKWLKVAMERGGKITDFQVGEKHETQPGDRDHVAWPFPTVGATKAEPPPQSVTIERSQPGTRTARGREATAKFIDAHGSAKS